MPEDLHSLPRLRDSLSYIYIDKAIIEQDALSIVAHFTLYKGLGMPHACGDEPVIFI